MSSLCLGSRVSALAGTSYSSCIASRSSMVPRSQHCSSAAACCMVSLTGSSAVMSSMAPLPASKRALLPSRCTLGASLGSRSRLRRGDLAATAAFRRGEPEYGDRVVAGLPYLLPLLDALPYGKFLFFQFPFIARALAPLGPLNGLYHAFPFAPFLVFLGVYSLTSNFNFSRFVRYNAMQAILLDILLIIPSLILNTVFDQPTDPLGLAAYTAIYNTIFLFVCISVAYGMGSCGVGQTPRLPLVATAADAQVRDV